MADRKQGQQAQFLTVCSRDEAVDRLWRMLQPAPLAADSVPLARALGRVPVADQIALVNVPAFDRSNVDGFAVRAADIEAAAPDRPVRLRLTGDVLTPGVAPECAVEPGTASLIATGGMLPRGADAVVLVEKTTVGDGTVLVESSVRPGAFITFSGSDMALGETVLYGGQPLEARDIGLLAAVGIESLKVYRRPQVAVISTGNEVVMPGCRLRPGGVFDSNAAILQASLEEIGCEPAFLGVVPDRPDLLRERLLAALEFDAVILSGGTSKGEGDVVHQVVAELDRPGVIVHGVSVRPGKPLCLAVQDERLVAVLPGFPTSAIFTFHEFIAPVLRRLAGRHEPERATLDAVLPVPLPSELGRTDYQMVNLVRRSDKRLAAYPMPRGSGAVSTFSRADGFVIIPDSSEGLAAETPVAVQLIGSRESVADLTVIGSHCTGLDVILGRLQADGFRVKALQVGSMGGIQAARRGDCDVAGVHLLDATTNTYNRPLLPDGVRLLSGYKRLQGIVMRADDPRFSRRGAEHLVSQLLKDPDCVMVNRNAGSGTRILIDQLLDGKEPPGHRSQPTSHNAVAAAVAQGRADWGVTIKPVANAYDLAFMPLRDEHFDFMIPENRWDTPVVRRFRALLKDKDVRSRLVELGFVPQPDSAYAD